MKNVLKSIAIGVALFTLGGGVGCGGGDTSGPLSNVDSIVFLQRPKHNEGGDIFDYNADYFPGARLVKLSPPTASGKLTVLCCDQAGPEFSKIDIGSYDLSFDAKSIVFSAKLADDQAYGLFLLKLTDGSVTQIATDPQKDAVTPIFLPGDRIMFTSNDVVEPGAPQHEDEYERRTTSQLARVNLDGSDYELGPRHLSHRTAPSLASDGRVIFTQWDHLGPLNEGNLMFVDQDMEELREAYGKEGTGATNSTLKAREIAPGRFIAIGTARDRTLNAGALIDIRLGPVVTQDGIVSAPLLQSEANASFHILTPDVPLGTDPSSDTVGRYYDAFPLDATETPNLIVSWADGPVESGVLAEAGLSANFGLYLYDSAHHQRQPIFDDPNMWDIFAQPLRTRTAPNIVGSAQDAAIGGTTMIGSLNVYDSTLHDFSKGPAIYGVRVMEGFSSEEGFPRMFGTTQFEGHATLGIAKVQPGGSWSAKVPANIPIHMQAVDVFGMSLFTEPVWISGRAGEARICGGCHESRTATTVVAPGVLNTFAAGAADMFSTVPRAQRVNASQLPDAAHLVGVGWSTQIQPIFDAKCVSCHGADNKAGIAPYTITDPKTGMTVSWTFNLTNAPLSSFPGATVIAGAVGSEDPLATSYLTASYYSNYGPDMEAVMKGNLMIAGNYKVYLIPEDARESLAVQMLNPVVQFPTATTTRAFATVPHMTAVGHPELELTPAELYAITLSADVGGNFFSRENKPAVPPAQ